MTQEQRDHAQAIRDTEAKVLDAAALFVKMEAGAKDGTHAMATAYAQFRLALTDYHMAELALMDQGTAPRNGCPPHQGPTPPRQGHPPHGL